MFVYPVYYSPYVLPYGGYGYGGYGHRWHRRAHRRWHRRW